MRLMTQTCCGVRLATALARSCQHIPIMTPDEISHLRLKQQTQNLLSTPVSLQNLSCLRNAHIYLRGYSELRQMANWLHQALRCTGPGLSAMDECQWAQTPPGEAWPAARDYRNLSSCREQFYSRSPHRTSCALNVTMHYEWKSMMWSVHDETFRQRVEAAALAAAPGRWVLAVLNGGPHHFSKFADHSHKLHFSIRDSFLYPQHWLDDYYAASLKLFAAFSPRAMPPRTCVVWRTANIGPRAGDAAGQKPRKYAWLACQCVRTRWWPPHL